MQDVATLSIAQAARLLGIGRSTLYMIIKDGGIIVRKLGSRSLILKSDLEDFIKSLPTKHSK